MLISSLTSLKSPTLLKNSIRPLQGRFTAVYLRRILAKLLLLCVALHTTAPGLQAATDIPACGFAEIRGVVTAKDGTIPLPDVEIFASGQSTIERAATDNTGAYTLTVPYYRDRGPYELSFEPGLGADLPTAAYLSLPPTVTQVISGETTMLNVALPRGGAIQGRVTAADTGVPLEGVLVHARLRTGDEIERFGENGVTDNQGHYEIHGLEEGTYVIRYDAFSFYSTPATQEYETGFVGRVNYASQGTNFTVVEAVTTIVDFTIPRATGIVGEIHRSDTNDIVSSVSVHAYLLDEDGTGSGDELIAASFGSDFGTYHVGPLAPGKYLLFAQPERTDGKGGVPFYTSWDLVPEWYQDVYSNTQATVVEVPAVGASEPVSIDFTLAPGATITGIVTDAESGEPLPDIGVAVYPWLFEQFGPTILFNYSAELVTDEKGVFKIPGLREGTYELEYFPPVDSDYNTVGIRRVDGIKITVAGTEVHPNANFSIQRGGNIEGTLTNAQGQPLADIEVNLIDPETLEPILFETITTDANGKYRLERVAPGQYLIKYDRFDPCGCYNSEYYAGDENNESKLVAVEAGKTTTGINTSLQCNVPPPANSLYVPHLER